MVIRPASHFDLELIRELHEKFYADEFSIDEVISNQNLDMIAVTDDDGKLITFGATTKIVEARIMTDLDVSKRERRKALLNLLTVLRFSAATNGFSELSCSIQNPAWEDVLLKRGFRKAKGSILITDVL